MGSATCIAEPGRSRRDHPAGPGVPDLAIRRQSFKGADQTRCAAKIGCPWTGSKAGFSRDRIR